MYIYYLQKGTKTMKNINENAFPNFDTSYELTSNIYEDLEDCISDIFLKYQELMNIKDGGVPWDLEADMSNLTEQLSECISKALEIQKSEILTI